jgi:predicted transcriptional regulator
VKGDLLGRLELAMVMLRELERSGGLKGLGHTMLENLSYRKHGFSHARFEWMFVYLRENGFLQKSGDAQRAPYVITERGRRLLKALTLVFEEPVEVKQ